MAYPNVTKGTIDFRQGTYGWTETYFKDGASAGLNDEADALRDLIAKRIKLSGAQTFVSYAKVSNEATKRDVKVLYFGEPGAGAYQGTTGHDSAPQATALQSIQKSTDNQHTSIKYLRGIWQDLITTGGSFNWDDGSWTAVFNAYTAQVFAGPWGFIAKDPASLAPSFITALVANAGGQIDVTTQFAIFNGGQLNKKTKVFISGVTGAVTVNGTQVVVPSAVDAFTTVARLPIFPYTGGGQVTPNTPQFFAIAAFTRGRVLERKAGRPAYQSRGRQRVRKLA